MGQRHAGTIFRILRKSGTEVKGCVQYFPGRKSGTAVRLQGGQEDSGLEIGPGEAPGLHRLCMLMSFVPPEHAPGCKP